MWDMRKRRGRERGGRVGLLCEGERRAAAIMAETDPRSGRGPGRGVHCRVLRSRELSGLILTRRSRRDGRVVCRAPQLVRLSLIPAPTTLPGTQLRPVYIYIDLSLRGPVRLRTRRTLSSTHNRICYARSISHVSRDNLSTSSVSLPSSTPRRSLSPPVFSPSQTTRHAPLLGLLGHPLLALSALPRTRSPKPLKYPKLACRPATEIPHAKRNGSSGSLTAANQRRNGRSSAGAYSGAYHVLTPKRQSYRFPPAQAPISPPE
ncbi:hypothetical protein OH77DRAFT_1094761 [Trametes cingulata]|nr:hypothetical protein OH77DRAFT_1094761 [Trametes cingulata]